MTNKNVNVSIKIPCSENFDNFVNTDKGGYCSSCKKNVIDFRLKSDEELKAILNKPSNKVCGYFDKSQLKIYNYNNISIKKQYSNNLINTGILSFSLLSLISVNNVFSQKKTNNFKIVQPALVNKEKTIEIDNSKEFIIGVINDEEGLPLIGVSVVVKGTNIISNTNFDGIYKIPKKNIGKNDVLLASYLGFETKEIKILDKVNYLKPMVMSEMKCLVLGEVSIDEVYESKPSLLQKLKGFFND